MGLQILNCKYCGARLDLTETVGRVVRCKYCNTAHILARSDRAKNFLDQGEHDLDTCRFSDAYTAYEKAAEIDPEEPEAYFGMALATFKVQMLKDEVNNCLQPICHETTDKKFTESKSFLKALALATNEQRAVYEKKGAEIDYILGEFCRLKKSGLDYDCFICAKVTEEDGKTKTADCNRANDLYYYLKDEGYKPFFSERDLKGRTGSDYEALILYALSVSKCMLIVCSNEKYLQTKWMKNEYTRFMAMIANEEKARDAITFVFSGEPIRKLPNGKKIQGIDVSKPDAYARIVGFVKNHIAAPVPAESDQLRKQQQEQMRNREMEELRAQLAELQKMQSQGNRQGALPQSEDPQSEEPRNEAPQTVLSPAPAEKSVKTVEDYSESLFQEGEEFYDAEKFTQAAEKYRLAADLGHAGAQNALGFCYENGQGARKSYKEAVKWYTKAAEQGYAKAQRNLGVCYDYGRGVRKSYKEAVKWYRKAAEQGDSDAQRNLGFCYEDGRGVPRSYEEALKWYRKASEQGDSAAQLFIAFCYEGGKGVPQSYEEAAKWYRKQGSPFAMARLKDLGYSEKSDETDAERAERLFQEGENLYDEEEYDQAVKKYRIAANLGHADAQCNFGNCYYNGQGVPQSYEEAVKWYRKAAEQGNVYAQCNFGNCYDNGEGVPQSYKEAVKWYKKAAEQGYARAQLSLGHCYYFGDGVPQSYEEAVKWYRKAAEQGFDFAQYNLGYCYEYGKGVPKSREEAVQRYRKAAEQGNELAKDALRRLGYTV